MKVNTHVEISSVEIIEAVKEWAQKKFPNYDVSEILFNVNGDYSVTGAKFRIKEK